MDNKVSYNKIAEQWTTVRKDMQVSKLVIDFAKQLTPNGSILDIGCGSGLPITKYLCDKGFAVTGIDYSDKMIEIAKKSSIPANFILSDFFDFTISEKFDGIIAWDSLWHIAKSKQESIYPKISNLLKPNGLFLFTHGNVDNEHIDTMMGEEFYYSALSEAEIVENINRNNLVMEYSYRNFTEDGSHRTYVALTKKI